MQRLNSVRKNHISLCGVTGVAGGLQIVKQLLTGVCEIFGETVGDGNVREPKDAGNGIHEQLGGDHDGYTDNKAGKFCKFRHK